MKDKMVIFIVGTSYSGSTLLDMMLSNDSKGYSLGEVNFIFNPTRSHHYSEIKKNQKEKMWDKIIDSGEKNLYYNLFSQNQHIDYHQHLLL